MKIIQLITELYPAGAEKVLLNLSRELKKCGHNISVISLQPLPEKSDIVDDLIEANIPVASLNVTKFTPWRIFRLVKILKQQTRGQRAEEKGKNVKETSRLLLKRRDAVFTIIASEEKKDRLETIDQKLHTKEKLRSENVETQNFASKKNTAKAVNSHNQQPATSNQQPITDQSSTSNIQHSTFNIQHSEIVLHAHLIHANLVSRIVSLFVNKNTLGYKIINTIHIAEKRTSKWWHFSLDKLTFRLCDVQTAVSEAAQQYHAEKIGISPEKIPVIYNGIVPPKHLNKEEINNLKQEWGLESCSRIIGSVGRLDWQKGYDIFLKILPVLSKKIPKEETWGIVILGEGGQRPYLKRIIDEIKCNNIKIILPGYRKDAADCISAFDLFIMPSRYEGFGLTLVEAMAHGIPILSSKADSLPKLVKKYQNGECVNFESINITDKITSCIQHKKQKPHLLFKIENMANEYIQIYK